jgi:hypothetical protein
MLVRKWDHTYIHPYVDTYTHTYSLSLSLWNASEMDASMCSCLHLLVCIHDMGGGQGEGQGEGGRGEGGGGRRKREERKGKVPLLAAAEEGAVDGPRQVGGTQDLSQLGFRVFSLRLGFTKLVAHKT